MDKICSSHQSAFLFFAYFKLMHQVNGAGQFLCRFFSYSFIHQQTLVDVGVACAVCGS